MHYYYIAIELFGSDPVIVTDKNGRVKKFNTWEQTDQYCEENLQRGITVSIPKSI